MLAGQLGRRRGAGGKARLAVIARPRALEGIDIDSQAAIATAFNGAVDAIFIRIADQPYRAEILITLIYNVIEICLITRSDE